MARRKFGRVRLGLVPSFRFSYSPWCAKMHNESLKALGKIEGVEVIDPRGARSNTYRSLAAAIPESGGVSSIDHAEAAAEYFRREQVDGLIIAALDFGDERSAAAVAERLAVPVLLYATKEPPARTDPSLGRVSDSYCGTLSIAAALHRRKIPFVYAGLFLPEEKEFRDAARVFAGAVATVRGLRNARIGHYGVRPATFETVTYNETALIGKFRQTVMYRDVSLIFDRARSIVESSAALRKTKEDLRSCVAVATVSDEYLDMAARLECAILESCEKDGISALAMQCWPAVHKVLGIEPCAVFGRITERGIMTACEADVLGAQSMLCNYQASLGRTVPHLIDWTIRHREREDCLLAWHCGNAPVCLAADKTKTALRSRADMAGKMPVDKERRYGLFQFQLAPGPVTFCRLAEYDNQWKMLIARGEVVPSDETLAGTWSWVQVKDLNRLYRTLVEEGFIHHASMVHGDQAQILKQACTFLDVKPVVVE